MREAKSIPANSFPDDKLGRFDSLSNLGQRTAYRCSKSATLPEVPSRIVDYFVQQGSSLDSIQETWMKKHERREIIDYRTSIEILLLFQTEIILGKIERKKVL